MHKHMHILVAVLFLTCAAGAGCSSTPKDPFEEWNAGSKYHNYVPATAKTVAQGVGTLTFTAPANGTAYLLDTSEMVKLKEVTKPKVIISGWLPAGTEVTFDPAAKRVYAKGRSGVGLTDVDPAHTHELRFDRVKQEQ
jgi:hypothetical protein